MTERNTPWPVGAPAWVDISVTDLERSKQFYTAVLGWDYTGGDAAFGGYVNATVHGRAVAGMAPPMQGVEETPHVWTTYLAVDDSVATQAAIEAAGGRTAMAPMEVGPFGTMGIFADPTGAVFGTWQAGSHTGFELYGVTGAVGWCEAMVADFEKGKEFYTEVFGWGYTDLSSEQMQYATFGPAEDESNMSGGIGTEPGRSPYWAVTFGVDGTDEAVERVKEAGGGVLVEPFDFEYGRLAVATGPDGEQFGLLTGTGS